MSKTNYIRFDWAVKKILRDKANFEVLEGLLTVLLNEQVKIESIIESEKNRERKDAKANRVDIKAKNSKGEIIIIEVQNLYQMDFIQRILFGAASAITEQISMGEPYEKIKKVYSISIVYFDLGQGADYLYRGQTSLVGEFKGDVLQLTQKEREAYGIEGTHDLFPEFIVIRVNDFDKVALTSLDAWIEYLRDGAISNDVEAPGFRRLRQVLNFESMTKAEYEEYMNFLNDLKCEKDSMDDAYSKGKEEGREEGIREGREEGMKEGREEGAKHKALQIATAMKSMGLPVDVIAKATGLGPEDIKDI